MRSASALFSTARWQGCRFSELTLQELQLIHMARQEVFVVEQQCAYVDADCFDEQAFHLAAWAPTHRLPLAYARVVDPGVKYPEPSIGRVLTSAAGRGRGLGRELVQLAVAHTIEAFPGQGIRISAQSHLAAFYQSVGFGAVGECYLEDGIPHIQMLRPG